MRDLPNCIAAPPMTSSRAVNLSTTSIGVSFSRCSSSCLIAGIETAHVLQGVERLGRCDPLGGGMAEHRLERRLDVLLELGSRVGAFRRPQVAILRQVAVRMPELQRDLAQLAVDIGPLPEDVGIGVQLPLRRVVEADQAVRLDLREISADIDDHAGEGFAGGAPEAARGLEEAALVAGEARRLEHRLVLARDDFQVGHVLLLARAACALSLQHDELPFPRLLSTPPPSTIPSCAPRDR